MKHKKKVTKLETKRADYDKNIRGKAIEHGFTRPGSLNK
jgi:hypothetical protein